MRVAHVITRMIVGGAQENTLLNCLDLIRDFDDEVVLITGPSLGPEGELLSQGRAEGLPVIRINTLRRPIHPWRDWLSYRELIRVLREFQPDVVHTHSAKGGILGRFAAHHLGVPAIIHTVHGAPFHPYQNVVPRTCFRWCETLAARRCRQLISVADAMTDQLVAAGVAPREKFETVYSGMEVEPFLQAGRFREARRTALGYASEDVVVGKIARLFKLKGHEYLIDAARDIVRREPRVKFLLIGDGLLREQLESQISAAGLTEHFRFEGLIQPEQIPEYVGALDVLVHCSLREGLARTLPQALIAGKPAVSFDVDGAREVVLPDQTGFLVPPRDTAGLRDAILALAADPALRERLGSAGRERFCDQFRHQTMTAHLRRIYQRIREPASS